MQEIPLTTTVISANKTKKLATSDDGNAALNSTQRFKQDLIKANKSAVDISFETKHLETPDTFSIAPPTPTVAVYPPNISQPHIQTTNTTIAAKSKQKGKEKEK